MIDTPLYPLAIVAVVLAAAAAAGRRTSGSRWGAAMLIVAVVQVPGYFVVSRMMYATGELMPQQLLFAAVATAITTKLVVFAPLFLGQLTDPEFQPTLDRHTVVAGLVASWLIQASLAVLYLFPDSMLRVALAWLTPSSPLHVYVVPFAIGAVLAQVTFASQLYDHDRVDLPTPLPSGDPDALDVETPVDRAGFVDDTEDVVVAVADGGNGDEAEASEVER